MQFATMIPTAYNDGREVPPSEWRAITMEAVSRFGGCTISEPMEGSWQGAEKVYHDTVRRLMVVCGNEQLAEAQEFVTQIGIRLQQEAMFFEVRDFDGVRFLAIPKPNA